MSAPSPLHLEMTRLPVIPSSLLLAIHLNHVPPVHLKQAQIYMYDADLSPGLFFLSSVFLFFVDFLVAPVLRSPKDKWPLPPALGSPPPSDHSRVVSPLKAPSRTRPMLVQQTYPKTRLSTMVMIPAW